MTTYHVSNEDGTRGVCSAQPEQCPYTRHGHYDTAQEAAAQSDYVLEQQFGDTLTKNQEKSVAQAREELMDDSFAVSEHWRNGTRPTNPAAVRHRMQRNRDQIAQYISDETSNAIMSSDSADAVGQRVRELKENHVAVGLADSNMALLDNAAAQRSLDTPDDTAVDEWGNAPLHDTHNSVNRRINQFDVHGNTQYGGVDTVDDVVVHNGQSYTRLTESTHPTEPYAFRVQVGRELSEDEAQQLSGCIGYAYSKTGGESIPGYEQDAPNSVIVHTDTTKGRAYKRLGTFLEDLPSHIQEGSPVRHTDRKGPGTKGTRLVDGLGDVGGIEVYADNVEHL